MFHFERQVGPRLKSLFELNMEKLPSSLATRLQRLKNTEAPGDDSAKQPGKPRSGS